MMISMVKNSDGRDSYPQKSSIIVMSFFQSVDLSVSFSREKNDVQIDGDDHFIVILFDNQMRKKKQISEYSSERKCSSDSFVQRICFDFEREKET